MRYAVRVANLVLGPVLRYVDDTSATVWLETDRPCTAEVLGCTAETFRVGGHHYALVPVRGLEPGSSTEYEVRLDGAVVWPDAGAHPPSRIRTIAPGAPVRLLFGSCRSGPTEDGRRSRALGPDALEACARRLMDSPAEALPEAMLFLGDQVYADQLSPQVRRELAARRRGSSAPDGEIADFEDYTALYRTSWGEPLVRWLLSTVPSAMIFDDHDVRDDWNTSRAWREQMARLPWWSERILGGLVSYWVYQHIGNLSPDELDRDETYRAVLAAGRGGDALEVLREFAARADAAVGDPEVEHVRFSYSRQLGALRLVVLDTRAGRVLDERRAMLPEAEFAWLREQLGDDPQHVVVAASLPWLLPHAVHHAQSWNEAACRGRRAGLAERVRQAGDLEHWAAFRDSFDRLTGILREAAERAASVAVLGGDVHHSYLAEAAFDPPPGARVVQVTCSPMHNAAPAHLVGPLRMGWSKALARLFGRLAGRAGVPPVPISWRRTAGPHFGNAVGVLEVRGREALVALQRADDDGGLSTLHRERLT